MTDHPRRLVAQGAGFALAIVVATAFAGPSRGLAAPTADTALTPASAGGASVKDGATSPRPSMVVNRDDGDPIDPEVRHHWPNLDDDGSLGPLVRHHWPSFR